MLTCQISWPIVSLGTSQALFDHVDRWLGTDHYSFPFETVLPFQMLKIHKFVNIVNLNNSAHMCSDHYDMLSCLCKLCVIWF